jgi:hypothetical protein
VAFIRRPDGAHGHLATPVTAATTQGETANRRQVARWPDTVTMIFIS